MQPRLTIGIPTHNRPELLPLAIESCLEQTIPVRIIVSDNSDTDETEDLMAARRVGHSRIDYLRSEGATLWENWRASADRCDTEFFAWLQDDDIIFDTFAERVISAFDKFPESDLYMAPLKLAISPELSYEAGGNFPWILYNHRRNKPIQWEGQLIVATSYFTSHSLCPGQAFRRGPAFDRVFAWMPPDCDLFAERIQIAAAAFDGCFIADPATAGLWIHHDGPESNLNYKQHDDQPRQTAVLVDWLDDLMDRTEGWEEVLFQWASLMHPNWICGWCGQLDVTAKEGKPGKYIARIREILVGSLRGRVHATPIHEGITP